MMIRKIGLVLSVLLLLASGSVSVFAANVFLNPGFEYPPADPVDHPTVRQIADGVPAGGWKSTTPLSDFCDGSSMCRAIEFWANGIHYVSPPQGLQFIELNGLVESMVYQPIFLTNGDTFKWSFLHRGRRYAWQYDNVEFRIGIPDGYEVPMDSYGFVIATLGTTNNGQYQTPKGPGTITATPVGNGWVRYSGTYTYTGASQIVNVGYNALRDPLSPPSSVGNFIDDANLEINGCCDQMRVTPFWIPDVSVEYRTFEIFNVKYPSSDICSIDIDIRNASDQQPPSGWQGGGLFVNGLPMPIPAWWRLPYERIPNGKNGETQIAGNPNFNSPAVKFNLGIDYSTPYTGTVFLTINHCDGNICKLTLNNWTPHPAMRIGVPVNETYPIGFEQALVAVTVKFRGMKNTKGLVKWIVIEALDTDAEVFSVDADSSKNSAEKNNLAVVSSEKREKVALYKLAQPVNLEKGINGEINLVLKRAEKSSHKPRLKYIFFDESGSPIGYTTN